MSFPEKHDVILVIFALPFLLLSFTACASNEKLITQPSNFQPESFHSPNEYGIKNATEFLKQSEFEIKNSTFVPARVEGGLQVLMNNVQFPYEAQRQFQEGKVYMNVFFDKTGEVVFIRILESPDNRLSRYSIYAVQNTVFLPATLNDKPVKSTRLLMFNYNFQLDNEVNY